MKLLPALLCLALCALPATAQSPAADFDIHVARLVRAADGALRVDSLRNVTARRGYDNQPHFTADGGALLYTRQADDGQTDIWRYDIVRGVAAPVTATPESEYSPTPLAGGGFAVIRVEADSTQRLWRFADDGGGAALLFEDVKPVGYQAWLDDHAAALFVLGSPNSLQLATLGRPGARRIAEGIGRALQRVPGSARISFVHQRPDGSWITLFDPAARDSLRAFAPVPVDSTATAQPVQGEYHAWLPDGTLLATAGARLFARPPGTGVWRVLADYSAAGWRLSRIAVDARGERIALVVETR